MPSCNFFFNCQWSKRRKEEGREGGKISLNISNLISMMPVNKEHSRLCNNCQ